MDFFEVLIVMKTMMKYFSKILLALFIVVSFLLIDSKVETTRSQVHSSQLNMITTYSGNVEKTDYYDRDGSITIAADLGYATVTITKNKNSKLEQFFDDKGEPVSRYDGYYQRLREYDEKGNIIRNTYLDYEGNPVVTLYGYATEEREYNDQGQLIIVRYYDADGNPAQTFSYGYGRLYEYDTDGHVSRIIYTDTLGNPMLTGKGYAIVKRLYYPSEGNENGKVKCEFYFDEYGNPTSLSLGEYGIYKEYDEYGRECLWTYLDAEGNPLITNKGYTTIRRSFQANNFVASERYFDLEGNPFSLSEGQYGVKKNNNQTVYLDQNGNESFNLKNYIYSHTRIIIPLALSFVILSSLAGTRQNAFFLILCIIAIIYMTLLFRDNDSAGYSGLLRYYRRMFFDSGARADIIKNIWLFIPLGAVLYKLYPKRAILLVPIALSALIEGIQRFAGIGTCELDDIISNGLGGWIGFSMGRLADDFKQRISIRKQHIS